MKNVQLAAIKKLLPQSTQDHTKSFSVYAHVAVTSGQSIGKASCTITIAEQSLEPGEAGRHMFAFPAIVSWGKKPDGNGGLVPYKPSGGYAGFERDLFVSAIRSLPRDAEIRLRIQLDGETTENHEKVGFHGDRYLLEATFNYRGKPVTRQFLLNVEIGPHNSARFGSPGGIGCYEEVA